MEGLIKSPMMLMEDKVTSAYWTFITVMFCVSVSDWVLLAADVIVVERSTQKTIKKALRMYIAVSSQTLIYSIYLHSSRR